MFQKVQLFDSEIFIPKIVMTLQAGVITLRHVISPKLLTENYFVSNEHRGVNFSSADDLSRKLVLLQT
jgi:hypothetical protein